MFFGVTIFLSVLSLVTLIAADNYDFLLRVSIWISALACFCAAFLILENRKWIRPTLLPGLLAIYVLADSIWKISTESGILRALFAA